MNLKSTTMLLALTLACGWLPTTSLAQSNPGGEAHPCGLHDAHSDLFALRPGSRAAALEAERQLELETQQGELAGNRAEVLVIPVVFHIIHFNGPENISAAQIHDAVDVLNTNFRALNEGTSQVYPDFADLVADVEIEFRLAQKDPNGNCHPGFNRIVSELTYVGDSEMKSLIQWPRNSYLNVWVCDYANGAAGYALYPGSVAGGQNSDMDGIVLQHTYCGSIGTANFYRSRTLTHEVGHWLNLRHPWGNSNNPGQPENCDEDDLVDDTPNTLGWTSCDINGESCGSLDNVQNYMEYSYCGHMFTQGQKQRMRTAALSTTAQRNQLSTQANLEATGVAGPDNLCTVQFVTDRQVICVGDSVKFTDESYHGVTGWAWEFGDGTTESGAGELYHTFDTPGSYDVTLSISNEGGETSDTFEDAVVVLDAGDMALPMEQGFEAAEFPSEDWFIEDVLMDGTWEVTTDASATGSRCMTIENWTNNMEFNDDFLRSSTMDMSQAEEIHISYKWAYAHKGTSEDDETDDRLRISVTGDCGNDWDLRRMHRGYMDLPSADPTPFPFTPNGPEEWKQFTIVLDNDEYLTEFFRVQFEFESRLGNNIYLDDINITAFGNGTMDLANVSRPESWTLAPNPTTSTSTVAFNLGVPTEVMATLQDVSGRVVRTERKWCASGAQEWTLAAPATPGVYLLHLAAQDGPQRVWRWVVR